MILWDTSYDCKSVAWFAWYPVWIGDKLVWMERVNRAINYKSFGIFNSYSYKELPNLATANESDVVILNPSKNTVDFIKFSHKVFLWCDENKSNVDLIKYSDNYENTSTWRIKKAKDRTAFILKWTK